MALNYIISLALSLVLAILLYYFVRYRQGKEIFIGLFHSFLWGMASIVIVFIFQTIAYWYGLSDLTNLRRIFFYSFVISGFGSEYGKYLVLRFFAFPKNNFYGPLDSITYSIMIALGFSFMSNVLYFTLPFYGEVDFFYAITMVFANVVFAIILGFFVGMAKSRENKFIDSMTGLFGAVFFHALYEFCFRTNDIKLLIFFSIGALIVVLLLFYKAVEINVEYKRIKKL